MKPIRNQNRLKIHHSDITDHWPKKIPQILSIDSIPTDIQGNPLFTLQKKTINKQILPKNYTGYIFTPRFLKVNSEGLVTIDKNKFCSEDFIYKLYPHVQRIIPRSYSVLLIFHGNNLYKRVLLHGYYKFGGMPIDEDSAVDTRNLLNKGEIYNMADKVIITEKINGKAAVFTMFTVEGELYVFGGSKMAHYVGLLENGIHSFEEKTLDSTVWRILDSFFTLWNSLSSENRLIFASKLAGYGRESNNFTACAEYEDGKHIIPIKNSKNDGVKPILRFFGLVESKGILEKGESFCQDVQKTLQWYKKLGIPFSEYYAKTMVDWKADENIKNSLRNNIGVEGYVIHYQHIKQNGESVTIGIEKFKTIEYTVLRILREFLTGKKLKFLPELKEIFKKRLAQRNNAFLNMDSSSLAKWTEICHRFIDWLKFNKIKTPQLGYNIQQIGMGNLWQSFQCTKDTLPEIHKEETLSDGVLLILQGIPGLGKTHLCPFLIEYIENAMKIPANSLEQDSFAMEFGPKNSGKACLEALITLIRSNTTKIIILARNNSNFGHFRDYCAIAKAHGWKTCVIYPAEMHSNLLLLAICLYSVYHRRRDGKNSPHPTLGKYPLSKIVEITLNFHAIFRPPKEYGTVDGCYSVHWVNSSKIHSIQNIHRKKEYLHQITYRDRNTSPPPIDVKEMKSVMEFDKIDYHEFRADLFDLCEEIVKILRQKRFMGDGKPSSPSVKDGDGEFLYSSIKIQEMDFVCLLDFLKARMNGLSLEGLEKRPKNAHVTLIYENTDNPEGKRIWQQVKDLKAKKTKVKVVVTGVALSSKRICCFSVRIFSPTTKSSLLNLVSSGYPHITALHSFQVSPKESIFLLQRLADGESREGESYVKLEKEFVFDGSIEIFQR